MNRVRSQGAGVHARPVRRLYKRRRAAELLDTSETSLKRLERQGVLKPIRLGPLGRDVHYAAEEIEALARPAEREG